MMTGRSAAPQIVITPNGIRIAIRLTPRGGRDAIEGWAAASDGSRHLKVRVSAPPEDGKANKALVALVAKFFGAANASVHIASGTTARLKIVEIAGEKAALTLRLNDLRDVS